MKIESNSTQHVLPITKKPVEGIEATTKEKTANAETEKAVKETTTEQKVSKEDKERTGLGNNIDITV